MSDFVSDFWNLYVVVIVLVSIIGCGVFLWSQSIHHSDLPAGAKVETMGHVWDETLEEYNHPLPKWWSWLFYITVVFSLVYLALYPGLGKFQGMLGWSSAGQHKAEVDKVNAQVKPLFDKFLKMELAAVAADKEGNEMGKRLYLTYCMQCHGADGKGSKGFPNLADQDWQWGGEPAQIVETVAAGRVGAMPPFGGNPEAVGGEAGAKEIANYVRSLSGLPHNAEQATAGKAKFETVCVACHGPDGKGMAALGAPNLTDKVWLYGSSEATIADTIVKGRTNQMPAWKDFLGDAKVHLLSAYVLGLSKGGDKK